MNPKVTIIIPFYNCRYVDQAISSALNQTYSHIEIIVVDDGSTDFTEKIDPFKDKIRYLRKENGGTATALNMGIEEAAGEYIAWLSSDDYFLTDKLSKQMSFMLSHQAEVSFTNYDCVDKKNRVLSAINGKRFLNANEVRKDFLNGNPINGCTVLIKKDVFTEIGSFNPFFRYTHDYEMWFRLIVKGYNIHYLDEVLTKFRQHEASGTRHYQAEMQKEITIIEGSYRHLLMNLIKQSKR
ncbi:glycosyltransferase involved in cell wall biosynthesis [Peribacillus deserti]|uniref:Glycosyltransferase involved in cell wall biosynthesis n=1 Tax=Peribacillus deserti TaxID=673318 RepID=A0ABS2QDK2_9BACI|nr:glycosyltransferase [Peribacillus deserti]MBM7691247.1 glycosyltransferase involved in cell wall biosynthesis [Peribacillus deserti]